MSEWSVVQFFTDNLGVIVSGVGMGASYLIGSRSRKIKTEIDEEVLQSKKIENVADTLELYESLHHNLKVKLEEANKAYEVLDIAYRKTIQHLNECKKEREALKNEMIEIYKKLNTCDFNRCGLKTKIKNETNSDSKTT